jgi:voltage-gated sodium channel
MLLFKRLVDMQMFETISVIMIMLNALFIGIQTEYNSPYIEQVQDLILTYFIIEIFLRWFGRKSTSEYKEDKWNFFDIFIVGICLLPESLFSGADIAVLRTFRMFRVFRLLKHHRELRLITSVLLHSIRSLGYSSVLLFIFLYVYSVIGVTIFKHHDYANTINATLTVSNPDPYGSIGEAMFTLFRIMTGEDWTDLRYNLIANPNTSAKMDTLITIYHVSWMIISGFLLLNLVVGAIVNNYDRLMTEAKKEELEYTKNKQ